MIRDVMDEAASDSSLLREYVNGRSEAAFSRLVERHMKLVYWTCRREIRDAQLAEDATQEVFLALARKAASLPAGVSISGWLFTTSRLIGRNAVRKESRRIRYEEEAAREMDPHAASSRGDSGWDQLESRLNDALAALKTPDREAILLRFLDGRSMREVAAAIGTTENAATKRVLRAVDRLRLALQKQEVAVSSTALTTLLSTHLSAPVPAHAHAAVMRALPETLSAASAAGAAAGVGAAAALTQKGIGIAMQITSGKIVATGAATALVGILCIGAWVVTHRAASSALTNQITWDNSADGGTTDAARSAIGGEYQSALDGLRRSDISAFQASLAPEWTATYPGGRRMGRPEAVAAAQALATHMQHLDFAGTLSSFQQQGDAAVATLTTHENLGIVDARKTSHEMVVDGVQEDHWVKRNGAWVRTSSRVLSAQATLDGKTVPGM